MKIKKRYIVLFILTFFILKWSYNKYKINRDKNLIVRELENYRKINLKYPTDLSQIKFEADDFFHYYPDSLNKSFRLTYLEGFMDLNCTYYESSKGIWQTEYTE